MKQGKANASTVTNTLEVIPDAPAPEPFVVGAGEPETLVLLNSFVVDAPPSWKRIKATNITARTPACFILYSF